MWHNRTREPVNIHSISHSGTRAFHFCGCLELLNDYKQLLDEVFVISRIIKDEVGVVSFSLQLRLTTLTKTLIILDITKTRSNNCFIIHWTTRNGSHVFASSLTGSNPKHANLSWLPGVNLECPWHDYCIICMNVTTSPSLILKIHCTLSANQKRVRDSMYNNWCC